MKIDNYDERFGGIGRLYGFDALYTLKVAHILIIGIGGVGSWVAEALARSGVGEITLMDLDDICVTNVNRQIHALSDTLGHIKTNVMAQRIKRINPECKVHIIDDFLTPENIPQYLSSQYSYVIDAIDQFKTKAALIAYCRRQKIPIITIGGAGGKTDPSQIKLADLTRSTQDGLLSKVRSTLRKEYHFPQNPKRKFGVDCVYSTQRHILPALECTTFLPRNCHTGMGAATFVTATFGFFAVSRVLEKLTH